MRDEDRISELKTTFQNKFRWKVSHQTDPIHWQRATETNWAPFIDEKSKRKHSTGEFNAVKWHAFPERETKYPSKCLPSHGISNWLCSRRNGSAHSKINNKFRNSYILSCSAYVIVLIQSATSLYALSRLTTACVALCFLTRSFSSALGRHHKFMLKTSSTTSVSYLVFAMEAARANPILSALPRNV